MRSYPYKQKKDGQGGFTLVELLVAVSIFSMVMLIVVSALLTMVDANRKGQSIASVMNNLNFALESMTRMARTGTDYRCGSSYASLSTPADCPNGDTYMRFTASDGRLVNFRLINSTLERCIDPIPPTAPVCGVGSNWIAMVGSEIIIDTIDDATNKSEFYVVGSAPFPESVQPRVVFTVRGDATVSGENTKFDIQSAVVQRTPDR